MLEKRFHNRGKTLLWGGAKPPGQGPIARLRSARLDNLMQKNKNIFTEVWNNSSLDAWWRGTSPELHIAIIIGVALAVHLVVQIVRGVSEWSIRQSHAKKNPLVFVTQQPKFVTLTRLIVSGLTFVVYFLAFGFVLAEEFHLNLSTYLASASVIGLAISFGSQGLVQDVVIGVTLICSNAMDVGEIVDLSGTTGRVEEIGLRFTKLINFFDQEVFVPNRNIANVIRFPHGGIYAYADIQAPQAADQAKMRQTIAGVATGLWSQFREIILDKPAIGMMEKTEGGDWNFLRMRLKIWPGQQSLIETTFRQQMTSAMKAFDPNYADWMVTIIYRATINLEDNVPSPDHPRANGLLSLKTSRE
jgi:moderate conductance mechanosensitive channel